MFNGKNILITGGTGSFGKQLVKTILERYKPHKLIIFSRDELKQFEMSQNFPEFKNGIRYFIGDVREMERLEEAFREVDYVIHAAALKQVPACEYNPFEAVKTNVLGAQNIIRAAIKQKVKKVIALSTDKAANPVNLYGATKLCSDKLFVSGNAMSGDIGTKFAVVRYGNVVGSRGSVIPFFLKKKKDGVLPVTDTRMTRFSITLQKGVDFVLENFERMHGGEVFVPKIPSYKILDVAKAIAPDAKIEEIGIRPGEKLHELMIPEDDARHSIEFKDHYVIQPDFIWWNKKNNLIDKGGKLCSDEFSYRSNTNSEWLTVEDIKKLVNDFLKEHPELK
ncbi:MAG TPA: UDP-N-acetylglucosamine 4,6-dehydratase (inverting) [Lentisphaeria bacterium]|nr:MAG: UDP-N-acetylglucosamine 4,6-dehydratase (inverting) [Lentisphaerae bacterium GWF2_50_93]HCE45657.1 UDP-N-acetylglucosamine 4,6-dehydratase (inverting) [Lentisphaeria bacterium]